MSEAERQRWEQRYADGEYTPRPNPAPFLTEVVRLVPPGRALVLACGTGRNALALAEAGFEVTAIDISPSAIDRAQAAAIERGLDIDFRVADLDEVALPDDTYGLITLIRFVNRPLMARLPRALADDGWIYVDHHLRTDLDIGGPQTPDFRLAPGELLEVFGGLRVVHYAEQLEADDRPGRPACIARLLACKGDPGF